MAYVPISNDLLETTRRHINTMRDKEIAALGEVPNYVTVNHDDALAMDLTWGRHKALRDVLPEDWTHSVEGIRIKMETKPTDGTSPYDTSFYLRSNTGKFQVPNLRSNGYNEIIVTVPDTHSFALTVAARYLEHKKAARVITKKWDGINSQVKSFLSAAKSLNEAIKLWPALSLYIGERHMERLNSATAKTKTASRAAEILAGMQTDDLTAAAVSVKLG